MDDLTLQQLADEYNEARNKRLEADKEAKKLKSRESYLNELLLQRMKNEKLTAVGASTCLIRYHKHDEPKVHDWEKVWGFIQSTGDFDLLQKRLTPTAVYERWDHGREIPGIGRYPVESLSISQLPIPK